MRPYLETRPYVGHSPNTPQKEAGHAIEPPVDSPKAMCGTESFCVMPAAPPELPPQLRSMSNGFRGASKPSPTLALNPPKPNSYWEVLPMTMAPSFRAFSTAVASNKGL